MSGCERTSVSDVDDYRHFCLDAASDEEIFNSFKSSPVYRQILEHVSYDDGVKYLKTILNRNKKMVRYFDLFRDNDRYGGPVTYSYGRFGRFSPTTLRYIKVLCDLNYLYGDLAGLDIVEIGVGYGGLCKIIHDSTGFRSYSLIDLDEVLELSKKYLTKFDMDTVYYLSPRSLKKKRNYDLLISNYSFSELSRSVQEFYLNNVVRLSTRGYMVLNDLHFMNAYGRDQLANMIAGSRLIEETPFLASGIRTLVWNRTQEARLFKHRCLWLDITGKALNLPYRAANFAGRVCKYLSKR